MAAARGANEPAAIVPSTGTHGVPAGRAGMVPSGRSWKSKTASAPGSASPATGTATMMRPARRSDDGSPSPVAEGSCSSYTTAPAPAVQVSGSDASSAVCTAGAISKRLAVPGAGSGRPLSSDGNDTACSRPPSTVKTCQRLPAPLVGASSTLTRAEPTPSTPASSIVGSRKGRSSMSR